MKKLLVILMTLLLVLTLPLTVFADEAVTSHEPAEAGTEIAEDIATVGGVDTSEPEVEEEGPKTTFGFFPETLAETLPIMGMGMLGIFLVTSVIILAVLVLSKVGKKDEED